MLLNRNHIKIQARPFSSKSLIIILPLWAPGMIDLVFTSKVLTSPEYPINWMVEYESGKSLCDVLCTWSCHLWIKFYSFLLIYMFPLSLSCIPILSQDAEFSRDGDCTFLTSLHTKRKEIQAPPLTMMLVVDLGSFFILVWGLFVSSFLIVFIMTRL